MEYTKEELETKIEEETKLIKELESSYPKYDDSVSKWHENNNGYYTHHTKVRDAYWRRRMYIAKLEVLPAPIDVY